MATTTNALTGRKPIQAEVKFMNSLEEIFKTKRFTARVYPKEENLIGTARVNTDEVLEMCELSRLIHLAARWDKKIEIGRFGASLRINFL